MKRLLAILALCAVAVAPVASKDDDDSGTSHESAYYTFTESTSDGEVTLMVASHIAYWHTKDDYFPVQIAGDGR